MPKLVVAMDGVVIKEVSLVKERTTLGRRPYNDVVIDHLAVSGEHAVVQIIGKEVHIEDLGSTNGTYVNGRVVRQRVLDHQDVIDIGKYKLYYLAVDGAGALNFQPAAAGLASESGAVPLSAGSTEPAPLGDAGASVMRVLSGGDGIGSEVGLHKVVTTVGRPGAAVAAVTRRTQGYVVASIDGGATLNGAPLGTEAVALCDGDVLELGGTRMQFVQG